MKTFKIYLEDFAKVKQNCFKIIQNQKLQNVEEISFSVCYEVSFYC